MVLRSWGSPTPNCYRVPPRRRSLWSRLVQPRSARIRGSLKRLQLSRANLIGAVLTKYDAKKVSYGYGYGEGHEYRYEYRSAANAKDAAVQPSYLIWQISARNLLRDGQDT